MRSVSECLPRRNRQDDFASVGLVCPIQSSPVDHCTGEFSVLYCRVKPIQDTSIARKGGKR
jgi:hypothetical protein